MLDETRADSPPRRRLSASERRASILRAASRVFARTGDLGSTTTKMIASEAGVNEAMLYRHFSSKEELFAAAVVEPLTLPIQRFLDLPKPPGQPMAREERLAFMSGVMEEMAEELAAELPALGLVLFGGPETAQDFHRASWTKALDALAKGWEEIFRVAGVKGSDDAASSARVVIGTCLMMALDQRHGPKVSAKERRKKFDRLAQMMYDGAFTYDD